MRALIVDGYNAIYKIPHLRAMLDKSLSKARSALTEFAKDYQRKVGGIAQVYVVFDGKDEYRGQGLFAPPHQIFSRSGEGDRAIIRMVKKLSNSYRVVVVSDDNFVRNNSRAHNASVITTAEFLATIRKKASAKRASIGEKTIRPEDMQEITEYLKKRLGV